MDTLDLSSVMEGTPISLSDRVFIQNYMNSYPSEASEYSFANLYVWRHSRPIHWYLVNEHIYFYYAQQGELFFMQPVGPNPKLAIEYGLRQFPRAKWVRIDSKFVDGLMCDDIYKIEDDPHNYDYIYSRRDLLAMNGSSYQSLRRSFSQFQRSVQAEVRTELISGDNIKACFDLVRKWGEQKGGESNASCWNDMIASIEFLENFFEFKASGNVVYIGDQLVAVNAGLDHSVSTSALHFIKSDLSINRLSTISFVSFFEKINDDLEFVNFMQDCGDPGLKAWKMSFRPFAWVQKSQILPV